MTFLIPLLEELTPTMFRLAVKVLVRRKVVLLVEDETLMQNLMECLSQGMGCRCLVAGSGEEAIRLLERHKGTIDRVFLDYRLNSGMDGVEVFRRIRSEPISSSHPRLSVTVLSGHLDMDVCERFLRVGYVSFVSKSIFSGGRDSLKAMFKDFNLI